MNASEELALIPPPPRRVRRSRGFFGFVYGHVFVLMFASFFAWPTFQMLRCFCYAETVTVTVIKVETNQIDRGPPAEITVAYFLDDVDRD